MNKLHVSTPTETTILLERTFDAPKHLVWRTLTEPELVRRWWGCDGSEMTRCEIDLRVGGKWRYEMRLPDGNNVGMSGNYVEIVKPDRIVNTESMDGYDGSILVTYTLAEAGGKTMLSCHSECHTQFVRDMIIKTGMETGAATGYDRMEQVARSLL